MRVVKLELIIGVEDVNMLNATRIYSEDTDLILNDVEDALRYYGFNYASETNGKLHPFHIIESDIFQVTGFELD